MRLRRILRLTALLLAVVLLLGTSAVARPYRLQLSDTGLISQYSIDDSWARPALLFAVREGLLRGMPDGTLHPTDKALRAEVAAMLMRIVRTNEHADLTGYTDVDMSAWYCDELSCAVAAGIFGGTAADKLSPTRNITRQETFTAIARMLGLYSENDAYIYRYKDASFIAGWAKPYIAALSEAGYLNGNERGMLNPGSNINRQELAQVFYNIFGSLTKTVPEQYNGKMLAVNADEIPSGATIDGDLLLCGSSSALTLENVTVTGRLVLQGATALRLNVKNCSFGTLVLCRPTQLTAENFTDTVIAAKECTFSGSYNEIRSFAGAILHGSCESFNVCGGNLLIIPEASVQTLTAQSGAEGSRLTVNGTVQTAYLRAENVRAVGTGSIDTAFVTDFDCAVNCACGKRDTSIDVGVFCVSATRTDSFVPSDFSPKAEISVRFTGVNVTSGFQSEEGRKCRIIWMVNNQPLCVREDFLLTEGATDSLQIDFSDYMDTMASVPIKVCVAYADETAVSCFRVRLNNILYDEAKNIKTVDYYAARNSGAAAYTTEDYPDTVKECWVNEIRGYSSATRYLLWISLWTQRVYVFEGSKGDWTLIHTFPAATGSIYTPTVVEDTTIVYKTPRWNFGAYYVHHVSVIDYGGRAFHSRTYTPTGALLDATMGRPVSHGCIRMEDDACTWIYNNAPVGSKVIVW